MKRSSRPRGYRMMAHEIEVKLEAGSAAARGLIAAPWLKRIEAAPMKREHLVSTYYDTPDRALRRKGVSLRVRRIGKRCVQTVKQGPRGACGPFCRHEWEHEIAGDRPELDGGGATALDRFPRKKLERELQPVFTTEVTRAAIPVRCNGSDIEIAIDRGTIKARRDRAAISEIEIELKRGDPRPLVTLAKRIARITRAGYGVASKAERGYALRQGGAAAPVRAREIIIDPKMTAGEAFTTIALSCVHHFAANSTAIEAGLAECVHQMRVGLRRLRAAVSFFKDFLPDAESEDIKRSLKWLLGELAPARDLDVLISESIEPLQQDHADGAELAALKRDLQRRRDASVARARHAIAGDRYRRIVLDTALWCTGGAWAASTDPKLASRRDLNVIGFAAGELARRHRKIAKKRKKIEKLDPVRRHKLRIATKKLRYADEFFASLYERGDAKRRLKRHSKALKALQSALGKLNDMRVRRKMAGDFVRAKHRIKKKPQKAFAMGLISGEDHARAQALLARAAAAGKDLAAAKPFWD